MTPADLVLPEIRDVLAESPSELAESLADFHPVDIAEIYQRLDEAEGKVFVTALPIDLLTNVFEELDRKQRAQIIQTLPSGRAAKLIEWMSPDDRTDFLQELPAETREALEFIPVDTVEEVLDAALGGVTVKRRRRPAQVERQAASSL